MKNRSIRITAIALLVVMLGAIFAPAPVFAARTMITAKTAQEIALTKTGGGTVTKCKLDYEDRTRVYEIKIAKGNYKYEMDVNAYTGRITDYEVERAKGSSSGSPGSSTNVKLTAAKAKDIALAKTGGGRVTKCKLDREDGIMVYEIEIDKGRIEYEMDIDANTGAIYDFEVDWD